MKIGIVSPNYPPDIGGTEVAISNITARLAGLGHKIVIVTRHLGNAESHESSDNIDVHRFRTFKGNLSHFHTHAMLYNYLKVYLKDVDVIHQFHLLRFGFSAYLLSKKIDKPLITSLMGTDTYDPSKRVPGMIFPYYAFVMNRSKFVTSPSRIIADYAYRQGCKKDIRIIPHGTDIGQFVKSDRSEDAVRHFRIQYGLNDDKITMLAIQRLARIKRVDILIHAARELRDVHKKDFKLLIVGQGDQHQKLDRLVKTMGLGRHVKFLGFIPNDRIPVCYQAADIFVFHTTFESFGLVLVEAMAAGKPIISTRVGAVPEVVLDGETGLLVDQNDPKAFADAMNRLLVNSELRLRMGKRGKARAETLYDWDIIYRKYAELYKKATESG